MSSTTEFVTSFKEAGQHVISTRRPWPQLLSPSKLSFPSSLSEASSRVSLNLAHFLFNYAQIPLCAFYLSLMYSRPVVNFLFMLLLVPWFLFFSCDEPLNLCNLLVLDDRAVLLVVTVLTLVLLFVAGVWFNLVVSLLVGAAVACLHAAFRSADDVVNDNDESPYGPMLSGAGDGANAGAYTLV